MNLFIDANIFLDFYHLSGGDIDELKKLVVLIEEGDILLFSSKQLQEEVRRNRDTKIFDALKEFQKASFKVSFPAFCKHYPEYAEIQEALKLANSKHSELLTKSTSDIKSENLNADTLISDLFSKSQDIPVSNTIFNNAVTRFRLGNPPGKKKVTMGDEVNWECLIEGVPNNEELHFVSGDGDYASAISPEELNTFLKSEWKQKKNADVCFYKSITDFFKRKFPQIKLASDIKVNKLIEKLAASGSFAMTHVIISELSKQAQFSKVQAEELVNILDFNTQVGWIIEDLDVKEFYKSILEKHSEIVSASAKQTLTALLFPAPEMSAVGHEIPF